MSVQNTDAANTAAMQQQMQTLYAAYERQQQQLNEQSHMIQQYQATAAQRVPQQQQQQQQVVLKPIKPDTFKGVSALAQNWLYELEQFFRASMINNNDEQKINYATSCLRGTASVWWRSTEKAKADASTPIITWAQWTEAFLNHFQPKKASEIARERIYSLHQGSSVTSYMELFNSNLLHISDMSDTDKQFQFLRGLHPDIYHDVRIQHPKTLLEAQNLALKAELDSRSRTAWFRRYRGGNGGKNNGGYNHGNRPAAGNGGGNSSGNSSSVPMDLGQLNDEDEEDVNDDVDQEEKYGEQEELSALFTKIKPLDEREKQRCMANGLCFRCRQSGHRSKDCPKNKFNGAAPKKY